MSTKAKILNALQHTTLLSGEQLAKQLGVSRNAIWKAIHAINADGFVIESTKQGYHLISQPLSLNASVIESAFLNDTVFVYDTIDSTNTQAKRYADTLSSRGIFVAGEQTAGRGRNGRSFYSPSGSGVYISLLYPAKAIQKHTHLVTPLAAVALYDAIKTQLGIEVGIKWVNDLFLNGKKVSGILTEAMFSVELGAVDKLIIGMGINVKQPAHIPNELNDVIGYLTDKPVDMNKLAITIINNVFNYLDNLPNTNFMTTYKQQSIILNKRITVHLGDTSFPATATDITPEGQLMVLKNDGQTEILQHGEVSIRLDKGEL